MSDQLGGIPGEMKVYRLQVWTVFLAISGIVSFASSQTATAEESVSDLIQQFTADTNDLNHRFRLPLDSNAHELRLRNIDSWLAKLTEKNFEDLDQDQRIDYVLLRGELTYQKDKLQRDWDRDQAAAAATIPYADSVIALLKIREDVESAEMDKLAERINRLAAQVLESSEKLGLRKADSDDSVEPVVAIRAAELIERIHRLVREMNSFYSGYDPQYSWWCSEPMKRLQGGLEAHAKLVRTKLAGLDENDKDKIVGLPIGPDALEAELRHEYIAYSPEELIEIAEREFEWCEEQGRLASEELGFGGDWHKALEHVKNLHVEPGKQPTLIRDLAFEAIRFLEAHDLVTVPGLAQTSWRMDMMSPDRQRLNPYFLGGDTIIVSFPTDTMTHEEKLMSLRSNNIHFSRATVQHELIPGHHLQGFMTSRYRPYRQLFSTPFWIEGWALYWEMLLWDLGFPKSAEDRIGMLFWRKHRCARIVFSLGYQTGKMTPEECVDYLVEKVGHERSAAAAEVRRSVMGGYGPLYQAAYMLGGLQIRAMHRDLVQSGKMTNRQFHDAILRENSIPIALLRAKLTEEELASEWESDWRFADAESEDAEESEEVKEASEEMEDTDAEEEEDEEDEDEADSEKSSSDRDDSP